MVTATPTHEKYFALLNDIDQGRIKIPQFQRDFVWTIQRSAKLLDSVVKGYPVGTLIFWHTQDRIRSLRELGGHAFPEPPNGVGVTLVLDGQQRLTSLYAAMKGITVARESGAVDDFSRMYIDLEASDDEDIVLTSVGHLKEGSWISLSDLVGGGTKVYRHFAYHYLDKIDEYKRRLDTYDFPIVRISDAEIDVATEIFTRLNVGGKALTVFEVMVAKTYDEQREFDLAEKFDQLVETLSRVEYGTIAGAVPLQLIALILDGECKKKSILGLDKDQFIDCWPSAMSAIESAVDYLRGTYRIPASKLLPFNAMLVPFAYFFYRHEGKPDAEQTKLLQDFFWRCALGGRYSSSSESKLAQDKRKIESILLGNSPDYEWGVDTSPQFLIENGAFTPSRAFVKGILCLYSYFEPKSFADNALVHIGNAWLKQANSKNYHHFFPRSHLRGTGVSDRAANNVLNITIVDDYLNKRQIKSSPPSEYMTKFEASNPGMRETMRTHLIGGLEEFGILDDDYDVFIQKRAEWVSRELSARLLERQVDRAGQEQDEGDFDEEDVEA